MYPSCLIESVSRAWGAHAITACAYIRLRKQASSVTTTLNGHLVVMSLLRPIQCHGPTPQTPHQNNCGARGSCQRTAALAKQLSQRTRNLPRRGSIDKYGKVRSRDVANFSYFPMLNFRNHEIGKMRCSCIRRVFAHGPGLPIRTILDFVTELPPILCLSFPLIRSFCVFVLSPVHVPLHVCISGNVTAAKSSQAPHCVRT